MTGTQFLEKTRADMLGPNDWVGKTGFMSLVSEAVQAVDWPGKGKSVTLPNGGAMPSEALMSVLVYCYVIGVYASRDIQQRCIEDAAAREICGDNQPDAKTVGRFRKTHRDPLKRCIAHICEQALRIRFGDNQSDPPLADYYVALALDRWFEPLCVSSPPDEAENRLGKASFIDGMSSVD